MIIPITRPNQSQLGCWEKAGPLYCNIGPWGPRTSKSWGLVAIVGVRMITTYQPYQTRAMWQPWLLRKSRTLYFTWAPGAHILQQMMHIYHCWCVDDQYLSAYQTRAKWLPCLLRNIRPFVFYMEPLGPLTFICGAKLVSTFSFLYHAPHMCKVWYLRLL